MCENLYSIEKLIEFGMGIAMAQQVIKVMNETINMPKGHHNYLVSQPATKIYVVLNGKTVGPLNEFDFTSLVSAHKITKETPVWTPGMLGWKPIEQVPHILMIIALAP